MEKKDIINAIIDHYYNGNKAQFAARLGIMPQTVNTWISRNTFDIDRVFAKCKDISAEWLLSGNGPMLRTETIPKNNQTTGDIENSNVVGSNVNGNGINISVASSDLIDVIKKQQEQISDLIRLINNMENITKMYRLSKEMTKSYEQSQEWLKPYEQFQEQPEKNSNK
ncbi:MAG: helix-turn-helix domain containing protein [Prevotellaceae bacterium]|jgi:hypothetical protein|nr:helix-turn-helix domain containing protein [Prevotellaceae bacterium]